MHSLLLEKCLTITNKIQGLTQANTDFFFFFIFNNATLQPEPMLTKLIISEADGTLTAFQQQQCL